MKLKTILFLLFCVLILVPVVLFWVWPQSSALDNEFDEVRDRHLLLASNLGAALERYHRDVSAAFNLLAANVDHGHEIQQSDDILLNLGFRHICLAEAETGRVIAEFSPALKKCPSFVPSKRFALFSAIARSDAIVFTEVMAGPDGRPLIYLLRRWESKSRSGH